MARSPDLTVAIERPVVFHLVDRMALDRRSIQLLLPQLLMLYREEIARAAPRLFVDKSHQNIWLFEALRSAFADGRFVGIERGVYGTVASMLHHPGVLRHFRRWQSYPLPNRHIGLSAELAPCYDALPLVVKCTLRWSAHHHRLRRLARHASVLVLRYEDLVSDPASVSRRLSAFLEARVPAPEPAPQALRRLREGLSTSDRRAICQALTEYDMRWVADV